ncbi:NAD(P)H-dependent flavin oxidoreductase [Komagataeibacter oboediens]|uniref:NAD(P)H-dependent flavin oxidoreductase n=1 Tax=Komagataeibacter oboediens TaxID=65958 RepID=UPI001C2D472C|nr:nitronate monooxygenase [Komagataeibacter oboediens]
MRKTVLRPASVAAEQSRVRLSSAEQISALKATGTLLLVTVTSLEEARATETAGMDAIVAQGIEAGGIMDGAGMAAAFALGAFAAQMGTAFILCPETDADEVYRKALAGPAAFHTCMTDLVSGRPARGLQNRFTGLSGSVGISPVPDYPIAYDAGKALNKAARNCGKMVLALFGQVRGPSGAGYASKSAHGQTEGRIARGTLFYDVIARACRQLGSVGKRSFQTGLYVIQSWSLRRPVDA